MIQDHEGGSNVCSHKNGDWTLDMQIKIKISNIIIKYFHNLLIIFFNLHKSFKTIYND